MKKKKFNIKLPSLGAASKKNKRKKLNRPSTKKEINMFLRFTGLGLMAFLVVIMVFNMLSRDKKVSYEENRPLQQNPVFTIGSFIDGDYTKQKDKYESDQFFGRKNWVKLKVNFDLLTGKREENGVYIGKKGQLYQQFTSNPSALTDEKIRAINKFVDKHPKIDFNLMIVPTASQIQKANLPKYAPVSDEKAYLEYVRNRLDKKIRFIDPTRALENNEGRYIYYRTDHHWTTLGAYIGYRELAMKMGLNVASEGDYKHMIATEDFYGSLHSKIAGARGKKDTIEIWVPSTKEVNVVVKYEDEKKKVASLYDSESLKKKDKYEVFTGGNHSVIRIKSDGAKNKRLLLLKDSYANCILPFLVQNYSEIIVVDLRYFSDDLKSLIEDEQIDQILALYSITTFDGDSSILNIE